MGIPGTLRWRKPCANQPVNIFQVNNLFVCLYLGLWSWQTVFKKLLGRNSAKWYALPRSTNVFWCDYSEHINHHSHYSNTEFRMKMLVKSFQTWSPLVSHELYTFLKYDSKQHLSSSPNILYFHTQPLPGSQHMLLSPRSFSLLRILGENHNFLQT